MSHRVDFFTSCKIKIFYVKNCNIKIQVFFISNQAANVVIKIIQLSKQPPTLKMLMQKILVGLWVKNFTFSTFSSLKLNLSTIVFCSMQLCTIVFRADTGNIRKIVDFTYSCLYSRPIKVVTVGNIIIYYFLKFMTLQQS